MSELQDFNQRVIREFRTHQGKVGGQLAQMPVLLLTMTGARSGRTLTTPVVYTTDGERLVVIASFAGAPKHPAWYHNLLAHPEAGSATQVMLLRKPHTKTALIFNALRRQYMPSSITCVALPVSPPIPTFHRRLTLL